MEGQKEDMAKEYGLLLFIQVICLLIVGKMFGEGPGLLAGFMIGAVIYGFIKESRDPGSLRGYFGNWKRSIIATGLMLSAILVIGVPVMTIAIMLTPSAAEDWEAIKTDYGLTGNEAALKIILVSVLILGFIAFIHLIATRIGLKAVAIAKRDQVDE